MQRSLSYSLSHLDNWKHWHGMGRIGALNKSCHRQTMYNLLAHLFINFLSAGNEFTQKLEITMTYKSYNDTDLWRSGPLVMLQDGVLYVQGHCYCLVERLSWLWGCGCYASVVDTFWCCSNAVLLFCRFPVFPPCCYECYCSYCAWRCFWGLLLLLSLLLSWPLHLSAASGSRLKTSPCQKRHRGSKAETSISSEFGVIPQQLSLTESKNNQKKHHSWTHFPIAPKLHFYLVSLPHVCSFGKNANHQLSKQH